MSSHCHDRFKTWISQTTGGDILGEVAALKAEIERLRGGQGEAVDALLLSDCVEHLHSSYGGGYFGTEVVQLYTSKPAPVSRPEHQPAPADCGIHPHNDGLDTYRGPKP